MMWIENRLYENHSHTGEEVEVEKNHKKSPFSLVVRRTPYFIYTSKDHALHGL